MKFKRIPENTKDDHDTCHECWGSRAWGWNVHVCKKTTFKDCMVERVNTFMDETFADFVEAGWEEKYIEDRLLEAIRLKLRGRVIIYD